MRTKENLVNPDSDYYIYQPSTIASRLIFIRKKSDIFTMTWLLAFQDSVQQFSFNVYCKGNLPGSSAKSAATERCCGTGRANRLLCSP